MKEIVVLEKGEVITTDADCIYSEDKIVAAYTRHIPILRSMKVQPTEYYFEIRDVDLKTVLVSSDKIYHAPSGRVISLVAKESGGEVQIPSGADFHVMKLAAADYALSSTWDVTSRIFPMNPPRIKNYKFKSSDELPYFLDVKNERVVGLPKYAGATKATLDEFLARNPHMVPMDKVIHCVKGALRRNEAAAKNIKKYWAKKTPEERHRLAILANSANIKKDPTLPPLGSEDRGREQRRRNYKTRQIERGIPFNEGMSYEGKEGQNMV